MIFWTLSRIVDFLKIDGGYGEGGGQIIRSAVALSCITKQPKHSKTLHKNETSLEITQTTGPENGMVCYTSMETSRNISS